MKPVNSFNILQLSCATSDNHQPVEGGQYLVEVEEPGKGKKGKIFIEFVSVLSFSFISHIGSINLHTSITKTTVCLCCVWN